jgi:hypothetical protein
LHGQDRRLTRNEMIRQIFTDGSRVDVEVGYAPIGFQRRAATFRLPRPLLGLLRAHHRVGPG